MRVQKISDCVRLKYGGNQSDSDVATVINSLGAVVAQTLPVQKISLPAMACGRHLKSAIVPFTSVCPSCGESFGASATSERVVKVHRRNGSVV